MAVLQNSTLESLLEKAKKEEKKYEWLQAAELYEKASSLVLKKNDMTKAAALVGRIGFCYSKAGFQAQTNIEFKKRLSLAIQAYEKKIQISEEKKAKNKQARIKQAEAFVAYGRSWLEKNPKKRKALLDEWWTLENQVLKIYESIGDVHSVGVVCTDMIEFSQYTRLWLSNFTEEVEMENETIDLSKKALRSLSKSGDDYELARAYAFVSIWYNHIIHESPELRDKRPQLIQKGFEYSKKALELSSKTKDAWLIGYAHYSALIANWYYDFNHKSALEHGEKIQKYGSITKDKLLLSYGTQSTSYSIICLAEFLEDPDKQRASLKKARNLAQESVQVSQTVNHIPNVCFGFSNQLYALRWLATVEPDSEKKQDILQNAIRIARENLEVTKGWKRLSGILYGSLGASLRLLSGTKTNVEEKKALLLEAQVCQEKIIASHEELIPYLYAQHSIEYYNLALVQIELAKIEAKKTGEIEFLEKAFAALKKSTGFLAKALKFRIESVFATQVLAKHNDTLGRVLQKIFYLTKEEKHFSGAIDAHYKAAAAFTKGEMPAHAAESYWYMAQLQDQIGKHQEASKNYESATQAYDLSAKKIPQLKDFYKEHALYMQAWSQIEQARYSHSIEEYEEAQQHYEKAAKLHESTVSWNYLTSNYLAWAEIEEAESLSRKEQTELAKKAFGKALQQFNRAEESVKDKLEKISSEEEIEMIQRLLKTADLRQKYCHARILVEDAKLLDREAKYLQSSKSYRKAAQDLDSIIEKIDVEAERKELEYLAILCQAWEKMADAEETTSSESYSKAAKLFEQAKEHCYTKKASLWALGNSNFCRGLAAGVNYQTSLELEEHAKAKSFMKTASTNYAKAGFKAASEYSKATQRLFDAYAFMNQAENELDQEKRAKQYQMAENLLQIATSSFMKAKQPEKKAQVQQIIETVREEKALALSLNEVMHAPTIASSTMSFAAPSPTNEASVGLEQFQHANVQANLIAGLKEVKVGESFCLTVEIVNAGKEPALLIRVEDFVPPDFVVVEKPEIYRLEESCLNMKGKQITPLMLVEAKVVVQPSKKGVYQLKPKVHYLDEVGQKNSLQLKCREIKVEEVILENRVSTGTKELDSLLLGGIPKDYAVVLLGPPSDERELIIRNFLNAGAAEGQTNFYVTTEAVAIEKLLKNQGFYLFLCNPKPKVKVPDLPNVYKLHGKTDLTNLNIALLKAYRNVGQSTNKRICLDLISDVLVDYGVKTTRKWIAELITELGSKGFTTLAVLDSGMHTLEEANAIAYLFDGEISLYQTEDPIECKKSLRIKKLRNKDYIKNPICLTNP